MRNKNFWKNKTILITGHTGFKGSWMTLVLKSLGANVVGYALNPISKPNFFDNLKLTKFLKKDYRNNILDRKKLDHVIKKHKPSIVFHMAAQSSVLVSYKSPIETIKANVLGTSNLLESCKNKKFIKSIVIVTTDKVYLNLNLNKKFKEEDKLGGLDIYSGSKAACEIISESYMHSFFKNTNINVATVRSGNCIGGGDWTKDRILKDCAVLCLKNKNLIIRSPNSTRPWQHVLEPIFGYLKLAQKLYFDKNKSYSTSWNFGPSRKKNMKVIEIAKFTKKFLKSKSKIIIKSYHLHESKFLALDSSKSMRRLKWKTHLSDKDAIQMTLKWFKNYYDFKKKKDLLRLSFEQINNIKKLNNF
tara:strand:+ start:4483 stop:5559 length:1077 start_codon:yes stop_codon:yes gene_type:complete